MSIFHPTKVLSEISEITPELLKKLKVSALILDVDNTLALHAHPDPDKKAEEWVKKMKDIVPLAILSNNRTHRVRSFALKLGIDYTANGMKPLSKGFREIAARWGKRPDEIAIVGDQIFTDILGANLFGCKCIFVQPLKEEDMFAFKFKRKLEKNILKKYELKNSM